MKKFLGLILTIIILGVISVFLGSFRYQNYLYSDYVFMLKENGKIYKIDTQFQLVGDRITGKNYILAGLSKNWSYENEIEKIFMLANSNYKIKNVNSNFYDGILSWDRSKETPVNITEIEKEISLHKKEEIKIIDINYKGKSGTVILEPAKTNPEFKSLNFWICSNIRNGYSCGNLKGQGIAFDKLRNEYNLDLNIEIDKKNKAVYFVKE